MQLVGERGTQHLTSTVIPLPFLLSYRISYIFPNFLRFCKYYIFFVNLYIFIKHKLQIYVIFHMKKTQKVEGGRDMG